MFGTVCGWYVVGKPDQLVHYHHKPLCTHSMCTTQVASAITLLPCSPFPTVAESIQRELDEYRASEEEVKRLKNVMVSHSGSTGRSVKSLKVVSWRPLFIVSYAFTMFRELMKAMKEKWGSSYRIIQPS